MLFCPFFYLCQLALKIDNFLGNSDAVRCFFNILSTVKPHFFHLFHGETLWKSCIIFTGSRKNNRTFLFSLIPLFLFCIFAQFFSVFASSFLERLHFSKERYPLTRLTPYFSLFYKSFIFTTQRKTELF